MVCKMDRKSQTASAARHGDQECTSGPCSQDSGSKTFGPCLRKFWKTLSIPIWVRLMSWLTELTLWGEVKPFGIFEKSFKPAERTAQQLREASKSERMLNFFKCSSSGDKEIDDIVTEKHWRKLSSVGPQGLCGWKICR